MTNPRKKLVVVGDAACGKTNLLRMFAQGDFTEADIATVFDYSYAEIKVTDQLIELHLSDTSGSEDYDRLRSLSYPDTNVILMCFSVASPNSLENILQKWSPEVRHFCKNVPVILVGNKIDLREDSSTINSLLKRNQETVPFKDGQSMAQQINAAAYMECSAKNNDGVREIFERAALISLETRATKKKRTGVKCCSF